MSLCGNRSPITGECIVGCGGFGNCRRGEDLPPYWEEYRAYVDRCNRITDREIEDPPGRFPTQPQERIR